MRAWLYYRLSRDDDQEQNSLHNQRKILLEYAAAHGYAISGESADDNASGMSFRREGADKIIRTAEDGLIEAVLVKDLSRLGRHKTQTALFIDHLREQGVRVISATEGIDTFDEDDDLIVGVRGLMNDYYARDIGDKVRAGYRQKQQDGLVIIPPFGYWKNKNTRQIEIYDEAAATVRLIFSLYIAGASLKNIAQRLNDEQHKTPGRIQFELYNRGKVGNNLWNYTTVKRVLSDESYAGVLHNHNREMRQGKVTRTVPAAEQCRHEGFYPAIIGREDWLAAQAELTRRNGQRRPAGHNRPQHRYAGLLRCGDCGAPFVPLIRQGKGRQRVEYVCKTYHSHGASRCSSHRIREEALDAAVRREMESYRTRLQAQATQISQEQKAQAARKPLLDAHALALQNKIAKLDADIESLLMERIRDKRNAERYDVLLQKLTDQQESTRQELTKLQSAPALLRKDLRETTKHIADLDDALLQSPIAETDLRRLVTRIEITQNNKVVLCYML